MALTRKFLTALGLEGDKVDEIINAHSETVEALKEERDTAKREADSFKTEAAKVAGLEKELSTLKEAAEKDGGNAWKVKYDAMVEERDNLKAEFDKYKTDISAKETKAAKEKAYRNLLKETGVSEKRIDSVIKVTDLDKYELGEDGKIKDSDKAITSIKEEWADFITTEGTKGAETATPPAGKPTDTNNNGNRVAQIALKYHNNLYGETPAKKED